MNDRRKRDRFRREYVEELLSKFLRQGYPNVMPEQMARIERNALTHLREWFGETLSQQDLYDFFALAAAMVTCDMQLSEGHSVGNKTVQKGMSRLEKGKSYNFPHLGRFVLLLIPKRNREPIMGDLEEEYRMVVLPQYGRRLAWCWYWWHTLCVIGSYIWKGIKRTVGLEIIWKLIGR